MAQRIPTYRIRFSEAEDIRIEKDGLLHCKTTPFYIFAQSYEGHYELEIHGRKFPCEPGGAFFTAPGTPLRIVHYVDPGTKVMRIRFLHFMLENAQGADPFAVRTLPVAVSAEQAKAPAKELAHLLRTEREPFSDNIRLLQILHHLFCMTKPEAETEFRLKYIDTVCEWIRKRAKEAVSVEESILKSGYSRSKFFDDFTERTGMPPGDFILRERIVCSQRMLLTHPEWNIQEVAAECGWRNPYHFSRAFKSVTGIPPRRYREHPFY